MKTFAIRLLFIAAFILSSTLSSAQTNPDLPNILDELNPFDPNIEKELEKYDKEHDEKTGLPSHIGDDPGLSVLGCYRINCPVWARIDKTEQKLYLYLGGQLADIWLVSTGRPGYSTPNFDRHPNGRIYERYTSTRYPGGDYNGLGNMPYAVFIQGGFAIHGTPQGNWPRLGHRDSHGCIRLHPDYGYYFNRLVRRTGIANVWITVE